MKRSLQFTIVSLLVAITLIAGYLAGHTQGLRRGFDAGKREWMQLPVYSKTYPVKTIVLANCQAEMVRNPGGLGGAVTGADLDLVAKAIKKNVLPTVWDHDPNTKVQPLVAGLSLTITGNGSVHREVERYLAIARLEAEQGLANYHVPSK